MTPRHFNVLFLCTGNSARSIMAEAIMNRKGFPNFTGYSAGSHPTGRVNPEALKQIAAVACLLRACAARVGTNSANPMHRRCTSSLRSATSLPQEVCPVWPGQPLTARWSVPDPAAVTGTHEQIERAFFDAFRILDRRISLFVSLPLATLERDVVQREIDRIGRS